MTFVHLHRLTLAVLLGGQLVSCAGGNFAGGGKAADSKGSNDDDKDTGGADQPAEVAGAFLTCTYIQDPAFGCTLFNDGKALPKHDYKFDMKLYNEAGDEVTMSSTTAPDASDFHVMGNLPEAYHDSGKLKVSAKPIVGDPLALEVSLPTKDIKEQPLGTHLSEDEPVALGSFGAAADTSKLALTSFKMLRSWTPAKADSLMGAMAVESHIAVPGNFCKGGQINSQLDEGAQVLSAGVSSLFKFGKTGGGIGDVNANILDIRNAPIVIGGNTDLCFKRFSDELVGGNTQLAHAGAGCIFVWARIPKQGEYLLIGQETQDGKKIGVDDLRAFAQAMNDRTGACQ